MAQKKRPEILAPVGGAEQLKAAVCCGADAVYFGMSDFNARRNADNFTDEKLADSIAYCHAAGTKVYITVNTLIKDSELSAMRKAVDRAALAGADGLIIQDLSVASYVREAWPDLAMHASTQMAVHNAAGAAELMAYGFKRIVLARELSLDEMRAVYEATGAELEVFVHGAHCMSVSGNCYISAMLGGRSGNRGLCAQPCRLDWQLDGRDHCLSLKDMSYMEHIAEIVGAGMSSLKIEGRMKRPEYVAAAVTACRRALEGEPYDMETLRSVFSRSGFTDGYLTGRRGPEMFGFRTKEDVTAAPSVLGGLAKLYEKETPRVAVDMYLFVPGEDNAQLTVSDGEHSVTVLGDVPQPARTLPLTEDYARRSLEKTGGTPYFLRELTSYIEDGIMLPSSALNALRRSALEQLTAARTALPESRVKHAYSAPVESVDAVSGHRLQQEMKDNSEPSLRLRFESFSQFFEGAQDAAMLIFPLAELQRHPEIAERFPANVCAEVPDLLYGGEGERAEEALIALKDCGIADVLCGNIGTVRLARTAGLTVHGGPMLNILNSVSAAAYASLGLADLCLSFEMAFNDMKKICAPIPCGFIGYGRLPLMKFRSCPARGIKGCGSCPGRRDLTDRKGVSFPLICREKRYSELLNSVPLYVADKSCPRTSFELLYFTVEDAAECRRVTEMYRDHGAPDFPRTSGLYFRELL